MMKKLIPIWIMASAFCYNQIGYGAPLWNGFYVGANAGYWASQNNKVASNGRVSYINPAYVPGASSAATALAQMANVGSSLNAYGLIGGAQVGYNYLLPNGLLFGINADFDGLTNSNNNITMQKTVNLADFDESYAGSLTVNEKINFLSAVRARLGYLYNPTFLVYATAGLATGNVSLDTTWRAQESLGAAVYPTINAQKNVNNFLTGWVAGAGLEWLIKPNWSAMIEYAYYSLNNANAATTLSQTNASLSPPTLWASANVNSALSLSLWNIRVGLNYHFA